MTSALISEEYIATDATSNIATLEAALTTLSTKRTNVNLRCVKLGVSLTQLTIKKYQARLSHQHELEESLAREFVATECEMKVHLMRLEALKGNVATVESFLRKAREKAKGPGAGVKERKQKTREQKTREQKTEERKTEEQRAVDKQQAEIQRKRELAGIAEAIARYTFEDSYNRRYI